MTSFGAVRSAVGRAGGRRGRASAAPPSASRSRRAGPPARPGRTCRRPGGLSTSPCAVRVRSAFCTVTGLAWCRATRARVDGSCAPGGAVAIHSRSSRGDPALLSLFMTAHDSATAPCSPRYRVPAAGLWPGDCSASLAFSFTVPFTRVAVERALSPLFIGSGRAVVAAVLAATALALTRQRAPPRDAVAAAGRGRRRRRRRLPAADVVRAHQHRRPATAPSSSPCCRPRRRSVAVLRGGRAPAARRSGSPPARAPLVGDRLRRCRVRRARRAALADLLLLGAVAGRRRGLRRGRAAGPRARRLADHLVGAGPRRAADRRPDRWSRSSGSPPEGTPAQWAAFGYLGVGQHVPGLLRLVPRPGHRPDGAGQPDPARPAGAEPRAGPACCWASSSPSARSSAGSPSSSAPVWPSVCARLHPRGRRR